MLHKMLKKLNPMSLLLVKDGYPPAVLVALLLHGGLLYFLLDRDLAPRESVNLEQTMFVSAMTIDQNPQRLRRIQQEQEREQAQRDAQREAQREAERQREQQAAREAEAEAEREREAAAERQRQEEETARRQREETERRQQAAREEAAREQAQREQAAREQAAREQAAREAREQAARERAAEQAAADNRAVQAYTATIRESIGRNWSIPPSARNGMSVLLEIRLVPTGEVISVNILQSSGDPAFDRSAEQAVLKAARFPELQQMPTRMFERQFRSFNLLFRPEDLLR